MKGLGVLTILCACAAYDGVAAQVPEPPAAPAPFAAPAPPGAAPFEVPAPPAPMAMPAPAPAPAPPGMVMPAAPAAPASPAAQAAQTPQPPQAPRQARPAPAPQTAPAPRTPQPPQPPAAPPAQVRTAVEPDPPGQLLNIQVDITITAEGPGEAPVKKVVSLTVADRQFGSVRSTDSRNPGVGDTLNVDVQPRVQRNGQILTVVGLEYANAKQPPVVQLRAQPLLESGRSLLISRAASPNGDRTVTVEVVARVLK